MMELFPELRRPWSDGLVSALGIQDYRDPFEIRFGLFGGDDNTGGNDSNTAGSDNVARNNPNEMAARERAAARAGTVTDSSGNPVTSTNRDGTQSVVTTGNDFERSMAQQKFAAETGNPLSRGAQDLAASVAEKETAALNRAAEAGRLASTSLANVGDVTQAQYGPFAADQPQVNFVAPQISRPEVNLSATSRPDIPANAQNMSNQILSRRFGSPAAFGIDSNIAMTALQDRALQGDVEAQDMLNQAATRGDITRDQADYAFGFTQQAPASTVGQTVAEAATAANVLGTSPSDMARTTGIGSSPTPTVDDLQGALSDSQLQGPPQSVVARSGNILQQQLDYPGTVFDVAGPQRQYMGSGVTPEMVQADLAQDVQSLFDRQPTQALGADLMSSGMAAANAAGIFGLGDNAPQSATSAAAQQAAASTLGLSPGALGGRIDAPLPDMVDAETDIFARDLTDPNRPGYRDGLPTGLETYTRPDGVTLTTNLAGLTEAQRAEQPFYMDVAGMMGGRPYGYELDPQGNVVGMVGTPGMSIVGQGLSALQNLISGPPQTTEDLLERGVYTGMSLQQPETGGGGEQVAQVPMVDPCPPGYQMVDGVCQPVDDLMEPAQTAQPGSNFVINPNTGLPTLFQPTTQATQVGSIQPFVLQPNAPQQIAAPQGIQALSPTGVALGRQV